ncbi:MAG TPA: DUF6691 family protein [Gammaproteobacteria bacterium]|nr:DUF6691 family protein [Gammaproteobacteria bacterium]
MLRITAFLSGLLFGFGLLLSGLANPGKVLGFLDLAGAWDPSLALVMAGAIGIALIPFTIAKRRTRSVLGAPLRLPTRRDIDRPLVVGSLIFGTGWGIAGICPGPAITLLGGGYWQAFLFVGAMLVGMLVFELLERRRIAAELANATA